jgi:O6-methylguanine-DNA--protein-cysteine methyltransferase
VVMSDGSLGGYSGLPGVKQALLAAEGAVVG